MKRKKLYFVKLSYALHELQTSFYLKVRIFFFFEKIKVRN